MWRLCRGSRFEGTESRDGGRDEPIEQLFSTKLMFANPFFRLEIGRFKARVHGVCILYSAPIDVKKGFSDPADFATTRISVRIVACHGNSLRAANVLVCKYVFRRTATTL
jgi:hypothetical protein